MKTYILSAKLGPQITTQAIQARDTFSAMVLATQKINANYVSDKRYATGEITLKDDTGKVIWEVKEETVIKSKKEEKKGEK